MISAFEKSRGPEEPNKNFTADEVLKTLRPASGKETIEYIGSSMSDFQAEPLLHDTEGKPMVFSDWEYELVRKRGGEKTGIPQASTKDLPHFFEKKEDYINRSHEMGENMFRLSLDFGRLCPKEGGGVEFNEKLMAQYVEALALVKARGEEPFVTLQHFTMPKYLVETNNQGDITRGAWEHPDVTHRFRFYIDNVVRFLADEDKIHGILKNAQFGKEAQDKFLAEGIAQYFMSINEPMSTIQNGYLAGVFPPYKHAVSGGVFDLKKVTENMIEAHDIAFGELKSGLKGHQENEPKVGVGYNWSYFDGALRSIPHGMSKTLTKQFERGGNNSDFLGLQYYFRMTMPLLPGQKKNRDYSDHPGFGDIYPPGIYELLKDMHDLYPQKQIFITEFGFSDAKDLRRPYWILETMRYILEAKRQGVPIKGMLLWSLVSNFEWQFGMDQKFGLFDELELKDPLIPSSHGVKGWEAWRAATKAITSPTPNRSRNCRPVMWRPISNTKMQEESIKRI